ncbi:hypothetical protein IFM89_005250 [Coptis chinensis]|uniref:Electron carrier/iron ion-binding protein n=1 Tax=Coptis chinensis TaxID=261450 RepID=A0A835IY80_9MAGN|nr:hypothetical protein IFM89_005250 [Coptis chinensis]
MDNPNTPSTSTPPPITTTKISPTSAAVTKSSFPPQQHRDQQTGKNLRGLNKPKCSQCGNVARSRCPFLACKNCCFKAQNPCPIHVLKQNGNLPDKIPAQTSPSVDQKSTDASPPGTSIRASSLRQLSQFNGPQVSLRARRPLTRKDAAAINQWRFSKLKEYKERNIEAENEAFDRYMQNVNLLEEAFLVNSSPERSIADELSVPDPISANKEEDTRRILLGLKAQLRSNPRRVETFRKRVQDIVDQGLRKLGRSVNDDEETGNASDLDGLKEAKRLKSTTSLRAERVSAIDELIDKLNKARNEDDLQSCLQMKSQLFNHHEKAYLTEAEVVDISKEEISEGDLTRMQESILPPRLWSRVEINQESLENIEKHFSSLDQIEDL